MGCLSMLSPEVVFAVIRCGTPLSSLLSLLFPFLFLFLFLSTFFFYTVNEPNETGLDTTPIWPLTALLFSPLIKLFQHLLCPISSCINTSFRPPPVEFGSPRIISNKIVTAGILASEHGEHLSSDKESERFGGRAQKYTQTHWQSFLVPLISREGAITITGYWWLFIFPIIKYQEREMSILQRRRSS